MARIFGIIIGSALFTLVRALLDLYSQEYANTDE
jgi:ABC-type branched-subunit amino acid transport system permease subunit